MTTALMSATEAIGLKINNLLLRHRYTQKDLAAILGISPQGVSRKILGKTQWSIDDLYATADFFGVDITDLLPRRVPSPETQETPDSLSRTEGSVLVAGAGFEPTTSGL